MPTASPTIGMQCYDANWWGSMDNEGWSKCDTGSVLDGFKVTPLDHFPHAYGPLYFLEVGRCCKYTSNPAGTSCTNANWWNTFDVAGWSSCPAGSYISGLCVPSTLLPPEVAAPRPVALYASGMQKQHMHVRHVHDAPHMRRQST